MFQTDGRILIAPIAADNFGDGVLPIPSQLGKQSSSWSSERDKESYGLFSYSEYTTFGCMFITITSMSTGVTLLFI